MSREDKIKNIIKCRDKINSLIHEKYHSLTKKYDLSLEQFHLLIELDELMLDVEDSKAAPTVGEIAKNINNSQNTVSERITRLENKGLVERKRDKQDRRISRVYLTDKGRELIEEMDKEANSKFLFDSLGCMEDKDIDNLLNCLNILIKQMNKIN
ncbi:MULTISPECIES: MarR family winged helix-turn-helix transcriptional regulator [Clostridium]|uniref:MarR family winged helix-turn-helix transcriptional regulator n=1 Tax=Clostridium TaxID=1485 RepID=UPI000824F0EE|nr:MULTISPECIES: MarR family transcriptional regulator [Clostridium]PJI08761.1 MarR family transcriptional regulator [Clostridium sp. CT7]